MAREGLTIGYACNPREETEDDNPRLAEHEGTDTIEANFKAMERTGNRVVLLDANKDIYRILSAHRSEIDVVFNNTEGLNEGILREGIVPFLCELLNIPYTGSGPQAMINKMDKAVAKHIVSGYGIPTARYQVMFTSDRLADGMEFPMMVKPVSEGTSIGITQKSKVSTLDELTGQVKMINREFNQPALVEAFLTGLEYTSGIIGDVIFPSLVMDTPNLPGDYELRCQDVKGFENEYVTALPETAPEHRRIAVMSAVIHEGMKRYDYGRCDLREGSGRINFLEDNLIPGLHPEEADLTNEARYAGMDHAEMINFILLTGLRRLDRDRRYIGRFSEPRRVGKIADYVDGALAKMSFLPEKIDAAYVRKNFPEFTLDLRGSYRIARVIA